MQMTEGGGRSSAAASATGGGGGGPHVRPALMKRQSSQSSQSSTKHVTSPSSVGNNEPHPLRHHVKSGRRVVLPRNHSSARNLAKLNRQAQFQAQDERKHSRQRSHEGDTEIRLPGSLDESSRPPIKRNLTASQLPRNSSHVKLKKNLSHGQLTRLGSGRNLAALNTAANAHPHRAPPSPGLKGKSKRPKSAEITGVEKSALERESERYRQMQEDKQRKAASKRVGFAVGSENSDEEEVPQMEGSGLQEDEWTEESASASPLCTRQNTANNSRRTSMNIGRAAEKMTPAHLLAAKVSEGMEKQKIALKQPAIIEPNSTSDSDSDSDPPSPRSMARVKAHAGPGQVTQSSTHQGASQPSPVAITTSAPEEAVQPARGHTLDAPSPQIQRPELSQELGQERTPSPQSSAQATIQDSSTLRSPLHKIKDHVVNEAESTAKEYTNPATKRVMSRNNEPSGPAVSNVSVSIMDNKHSNQDSSTASLQSHPGGGAADVEQDELVSRFVPSTSHPSIGSGANTALNTPKTSGFHTPEEGHGFPQHNRSRHGFQVGPVSPESTVSGSSGATTPAIGRSRTELRLMQEKALADLESRADQKPFLPGHVYDRRNESLKSFMSTTTLVDGRGAPTSGLSMGPQIFQGRFRAVNTELRVVQKYRDPIGEAIGRLKSCKGSRLNQRSTTQAKASQGLTTSKSAVSLPSQRLASLSKSASPPKSSPLKRQMQSTVQLTGGSERQKTVRGVSFAERPPDTREIPPRGDGGSANPAEIAKRLWNEL